MQAWQILLLTLYSAFAIWDSLGPNFFFDKPAVVGFFAGLIMGDVATGLYVGGTLQLLVLGVGTYGGSSIPDYMSGSLIGTAFAVTSGSTDIGLAVAVPAGVLLVQCDILGRFCNTAFQNMADAGAKEKNWHKVEMGCLLGVFPWCLSRAIPVFLCLVLGQGPVQAAASAAPEWLINGFKLVSGMLPAVGIAILLHFMPLKRFWPFALLGFVLAAYLKVPMLGVALFGLVFAAVKYAEFTQKPAAAPVAAAASSTEGGTIDDDE